MMHESPTGHEDGTFKRFTEREALELTTDDFPVSSRHPHFVADAEKRIRAGLAPEHQVSWVRVSDLLSSGTGRIAGRGIDFEAELARRLRHPVDLTRRSIRDRRASLPPLDAFGRGHSQTTRNALGRS
ncbi:hypothetical protein GCM10009777_36570 [Microbacterium pumilum]|uniref:Uncharacterized protein n=1 Tax=Microbacterium pumilum TaxID=344165 RepID=A0ABP5EH60_9MICO